MQNKKLKDIAFISSLIFALIIVIINTISWIFLDKNLLKLSFSYISLIIINIIIAIVIRKKDIKYNKIKEYIFTSTFIFTVLYIIINTLVYIIKKGHLWKIQSIFLIFVFSFIISAMIIFIYKKGFIFNIILYFIVIGIFYYLLIISIAGFGEGNKSLVLMTIYVAVYFVISIILTIIRRKIINNKNSKKPYKKQF